MLPRRLLPIVLEALARSRIVFLQGARQVGKSTLALQAAADLGMEYVTLDDATVLAAAEADPAGFVDGLPERVVIDEVQRAPALALAMKGVVDRSPTPGRYLLTGSADLLVLPRLAEALVGRMEVLTLWPLAQDEIDRRPSGFLHALFDAGFGGMGRESRKGRTLAARVEAGGFPEPCLHRRPRDRAPWFESYVTTVLHRDVRDLADVRGLAELPTLLAAVAARNATLLNFAEVARDLAQPQTTLKRYLALLEAAFLVVRVPAWATNLGQRLVKAPKLLLSDTGLAAHLAQLAPDADPLASRAGGRLLKAFVGTELLKLAGWSRQRLRLHHFRDHAGHEVDWILEDEGGRIVGIEVKASASLGPRDWAGLRHLQETLGERFRRGIVLFRGTQRVPLAKGLEAVPMDALWRTPHPDLDGEDA